jgi:diguanylate cyclase (GGDEF)-like protein
MAPIPSTFRPALNIVGPVIPAELHRLRLRVPARFWLACLAVALAVAVFLGWTLVSLGGPSVTTAFDDIGEMIAAMIAALACGWAARAATGQVRRGWTLMALAAASWAAGEAVWTYFEVVAGHKTPFPSLADAGFLLAVPLQLAAVLHFAQGRRSGHSHAKTILDGAIVAASVTFISWTTVLHTVYAAGGDGPVSFGISLAYPIGDLVTIVVVIAAVAGARLLYTPLALIAAGLLALTVSDSTFTYLTSQNAFNTGPVDTGWVAGFLLIALAAVLGRLRPDAEESDAEAPTLARNLIPYIPLTLAALLAFGERITGHSLDLFSAGLFVLIVALVLGRQVLALTEVAVLSRQLQESVHSLRAREQELSYQAFHDPLTGLANRALFRDRLEHALELSRRSGRKLAVLYLDLDDFKVVNDNLGHDAGDRLLMVVAERIKSCVRPGDTTARLGGDEFAVVLSEVHEIDDAVLVAERVVEAFRQPFSIGTVLHTSVSAGVVLWKDSYQDAEELLRHADTAMYTAKSRGGSQYAVYVTGERPLLIHRTRVIRG